jgi:hypothetical protein
VGGACTEPHRHFLQQVAAAYPPPLHFMPTSGSLNVVEASFSILTPQVLRQGNFPTVAE